MFKRILSAGLAALAVVMVVVVMTTSADENGPQKNGPGFNPTNSAEVAQAIQNKDYNAWHTLMTANESSPEILKYINETNFSKFSEMHDYMNKAKAISEELGLPKGPMGGDGFRGKGEMRGGFQQNQAVMSALESGNYDAFAAALNSDARASKMFASVTKDNFARFAEMHKLMKDGKKDEADAIRKELGLTGPAGMMKGGFGQWKGRHNGRD